MRRLLIPVAMAALALAGCGGGSKAASVPGGADSRDVQVIKAWVDALRGGDVAKAASYFRLPSLVENGAPPVELRTRQSALAFNDSLPCGAVLVSATKEGRFTVATFKLTDRPGGGCGPGTGSTARTAFAIAGGKITEWRRVPDQQSAPSGQVA